MILDCIKWPSSITTIFDSYEDEVEDEDEFNVADISRVSSYLKTFIESGMYGYDCCDAFEAFFFLGCLISFFFFFLTQHLQLS